MKKSLAIFLIVAMLALTLVSASEKITTVPDSVGSFEEWKIKVLQANEGEGFFATITGSSWGLCERICTQYTFQGDCNPCPSGAVASMCGWHPDQMSVMDYWSSASSYCNGIDRLLSYPNYDYYNKQCYCKVPTTECSGGAEPGERKCQGTEIWECNSAGAWEYVSSCSYGCSTGSCDQQQCVDHASKKCEGNSVYWYDSCGQKQTEYERCESDEVCNNAECVRNCEEGFIGSTLCSGNSLVQQYQLSDCSTEIRTVESCSYKCENSQCVDPQCPTCSEPTSWSQCSNSEMFRTNYECNADTGYQCKSFTETEACECGTDGQCDYDETCESSVCTQLQCAEDEIADGHECIQKSSISPAMLIGIGAGVFFFIIIIVIVILAMKLKGGQKKQNNG